MIRILGVDPGLRVTGYGAIECDARGVRLIEGGIITPSAQAPLERRLGELHAELCAVLVATAPDVMVIEELWTRQARADGFGVGPQRASEARRNATT